MKMIKVERENTKHSLDFTKNNINASCDNFSFQEYSPENEPILNFYTPDFLGILPSVQNSTKCKDDILIAKVYEKLEKIFQRKIELFADEKNVHQKILNNIVSKNDVVVADKFGGKNILVAAEMLKHKGVKVLTIPHNNLLQLEDELNNKENQGNKIWYLAQAIYPVPGSTLQVDSVKQMLERFSNFYLYVDDSYGLGWFGKKGRGFICENFPQLKKIIMVSSLIKGFGAQGAVVFATGEKHIKMPVEEPELFFKNKALLESILQASKILLANKLELFQTHLKINVELFHNLAQSYSLPVVSDCTLPVVYLAAGSPGLCEEIRSEALKEGVFVSSACFPEVPLQCSGLKINISASYTKNELKKLVNILSATYHSTLKKRKLTTVNILETYQKNFTRI